ncbi:hypothetical protein [Streptomyces sp. NPDC001667]
MIEATMTQQKKSPRTTRGGVFLVVLGVVIAALVVGGVLWARGSMTWIKQQRGGNAWWLTYEASPVSGEARAADVRYRHNKDAFKPDHSDERTGPVSLPWRTEVSVNTGKEARLEVMPTGNGTASCRILLDGIRVVAESTSPGPGKPAVCQVITSSTPEKWPR